MLESITVENIFCFKNSTTLSFLAGKERNRNTDEKFCGFATVNKQNILKQVYLYGNNGAGKSKFLQSFHIFRQILLKRCKEKTDKRPYFPFAFEEECLSKPSAVSIEFNIEEERYRYSLRWNATQIVEEKIEQLKVRTSLALLTRTIDEDMTVTLDDNRKLGLSSNDKDIIKKDVLPNNSILSYVQARNIENTILNDISNYIRNGFRFVNLKNENLSDRLPDESDESKKKFKQVILDILRSVDTNILDYEVLDVKPELPQEILDMFKDSPEMMTTLLNSLPKHAVNTLHEVHREKLMPLPLEAQSEGTKEILRLLIVLNEAASKNRMVILDDFSSGIQRISLREILKFFLGIDKYGQFIITTQDISLLDSELVRRDSVRLAVKDKYGVSTIENLTLKDIHKNLSLPKYLSTNNKYGQLPKISPESIEKAIKAFNQISVADIDALFGDDGNDVDSEEYGN
jgi:AAA15 family ATPase/GTPase